MNFIFDSLFVKSLSVISYRYFVIRHALFIFRINE